MGMVLQESLEMLALPHHAYFIDKSNHERYIET